MTQFAKISAIAMMAAMLAAPVQAATLNLGGGGGLLGFGGSGDASGDPDIKVEVDAGDILRLGGSNDDDALINVGGSGEADLTVDLFGPGASSGGGTGLAVGLGGTDSLVQIGGDEHDVLVDLFGTGGGDAASVSADLGLGGGSDINLIVDLFGPGGSGGGGSSGGNGSAGSGGGPGSGSGGDVLVANIDTDANDAACFTPDATQISTLLNRHNYAASTAQWANVSNVQIVEVGLCAEAQLKVAQVAQGNSNYLALQGFVDTQAAINAGLRTSGHDGSDVIAIDQKGSTLVVYVI